MALAPVSAQQPAASSNADRTLFLLSLGLFFIWGFATVLIDILIPKLRGLFELTTNEEAVCFINIGHIGESRRPRTRPTVDAYFSRLLP